MKKESKGITLITLVITIIIIIILSAVGISALTGDNSLIGKANEAKMLQLREDYRERITLIVTNAQIDKIIEKDDSLKTLQTRLMKEDWVSAANIENEKIETTVKDGFIYEVDWNEVVYKGLDDGEPYPEVEISMQEGTDKNILTVSAKEGKNGIYSIKLLTRNDARIYEDLTTEVEETFEIFENEIYEIQVISNKSKTIKQEIEVTNIVGQEIAQIGQKKYTTLKSAIADVPEGQQTTIEIIKDFSQTIEVEVPTGKDVIFDIKDYTITVDGGVFNNCGNMEITSTGTLGKLVAKGAVNNVVSSADGVTKIVGIEVIGSETVTTGNVSYPPLANKESGRFIIEDTNITSAKSYAIYNVTNGNIDVTRVNANSVAGVYNVKKGEISLTDTTITCTGSVSIINNDSGIMNINGGTITAKKNIAIRNNSSGTINIENTEIIGATETEEYYATILNKAEGEIIINGGEVTSTTHAAIINDGTGEINVNSCTITGDTYGIINKSGTLIIGDSNIDATGSAVDNRGGTATIKNSNLNAYDTSAVNNTTTGVTIIEGCTLTSDIGMVLTNLGKGSMSVTNTDMTGIAGWVIENNSELTIKGGEIKTTDDYGVGLYNRSKKDVIIEDAIISVNTRAINNTSSGTVTIKSGQYIGSQITGSSYQVIHNNSSGKIIIEGGEISTGDMGVAVNNNSTGTIDIKGGKITSQMNAIGNKSTGTINISGGEILGGQITSDSGGVYPTINNSGTGSIIMSGGTVTAVTGIGINNVTTGKITIEGGKISSTSGNCIYNRSTGELTIGVNDGNVSTTNPEILGSNSYYAIATVSLVLNFYDGIVKGGFTNATTVNVPTGMSYYTNTSKTPYETTLK